MTYFHVSPKDGAARPCSGLNHGGKCQFGGSAEDHGQSVEDAYNKDAKCLKQKIFQDTQLKKYIQNSIKNQRIIEKRETARENFLSSASSAKNYIFINKTTGKSLGFKHEVVLYPVTDYHVKKCHFDIILT